MIEVFYRTCFYSTNQELSNRNRPEWFDKAKCLRNILFDSWGYKDINFTQIYDEHFGKLGNPSDDTVVINCGTEASSFLATLDIIMSRNLPDDTIVYIVEDDYLHREGWQQALREAFELPIDYVSLYDHADKYMEDYSELKSKIYVTESAHWRSTPSTCNTYACLMRTLREDIDTHRFFSRNHNGGVSQDHNKFVELARLGRRLISPMPGFSTHCEAGLLSPRVDWGKI